MRCLLLLAITLLLLRPHSLLALPLHSLTPLRLYSSHPPPSLLSSSALTHSSRLLRTHSLLSASAITHVLVRPPPLTVLLPSSVYDQFAEVRQQQLPVSIPSMTSPPLQVPSPSPAQLHDEIRDIRKTLVSFESMVKENTSMFRSVMLKLEQGLPAMNTPPGSHGSTASSPRTKAGKQFVSGRPMNNSVVESSDSSRLTENPGYSKLVEELAKPMCTFRVSILIVSSVICTRKFKLYLFFLVVADEFDRRCRLPHPGSIPLPARDSSEPVSCNCGGCIPC